MISCKKKKKKICDKYLSGIFFIYIYKCYICVFMYNRISLYIRIHSHSNDYKMLKIFDVNKVYHF